MARFRATSGGFSRRRVIKATGGLIASAAAGSILRAGAALAAYPERVVRIVVANSPGGPSDIVARFISAALQEKMGKTFIVENKGGGGGNIGMGSVARADPDGYTLLLSTNAFTVNPGLYATLPYDPFKDFAAIAEIATSPNVFTVRSELKANTMKEFIALAKADPDKFNVSTPPIGTTPQLEAEVLKLREHLTQMAAITFTGGGEALQALLGGTVQLSSGALAPALPQIKAGAIKALAVTGASRWPELPAVPTMLEAGYKDFVFETYTALLAPAKTPPDIVSLLERETLAILRRPEMGAKLAELGFEIQAKDGKTHMARVAREVPMFREIITQAGIKPQ